MKKKHFIQLGIILCVIVAFVIGATHLLSHQCTVDEIRVKQFYNEPKDSHNMLLIGPSSVRAGFIPTRAYEKYGITSYDYAIDFAPFAILQYMLEETLTYQNPELILIDINGISYCSEEFTLSRMRPFVDNIKNDKLKQKITNADQTKLENYINLYNYHSNWTNIGECIEYEKFFANCGQNQAILKGYHTCAGSCGDDEMELVNQTTITQRAKLTGYQKKSIKNLLDFCKSIKDKSKVMFVRFPRFTIKETNDSAISYVNALQDEIIKNHYYFYDFSLEMKNMCLDKQDYWDPEHLNHFGAEKFTDYLMETILNEGINFNTNHSDAVKQDWDSCVEVCNPIYETLKQETKNNNKKYQLSELVLFQRT